MSVIAGSTVYLYNIWYVQFINNYNLNPGVYLYDFILFLAIAIVVGPIVGALCVPLTIIVIVVITCIVYCSRRKTASKYIYNSLSNIVTIFLLTLYTVRVAYYEPAYYEHSFIMN